ncbi:MAG TPA: alpha/beta hydrolase [Gallionella sp.]|nr:alpha/beta hydrolase [Gallionella sp.]
MKDVPEKRQVDIDGHRLTYTVTGCGRPAVVLINGLGVPLRAWDKLYPGITALGTVVTYDRPGIGRSSPPRVPQTGETVVRMLHRLLAETGIEGPYVLIGHSIGGLYANLFARLYPGDVAGVMMLEATAPDDVDAFELHQTRVARLIDAVFDLFTRHQPNHERNNIKESVAQLSSAPAFPEIPVCVVSGEKTMPAWLVSSVAARLRAENQAALARLSPQGWQVIASESGHFPQISEPALVVRAIEQVVSAAAIR